MAKQDIVISKKDMELREFVLSGNIWKVVLVVGGPLAFYQTIGNIFRVFDSLSASYISGEAVSAVSFLAQLIAVISAVGGGIAIGASIKISEAYGAGEYELVKQRVSSTFIICFALSIFILIFSQLFSRQILQFLVLLRSLWILDLIISG